MSDLHIEGTSDPLVKTDGADAVVECVREVV